MSSSYDRDFTKEYNSLTKDLVGSSSSKPKKTSSEKKTKTIVATKRKEPPMIWKDNILRRQKNKCAYKICEEIHQKKTKMLINNRSDFDHIKPLALGGKNSEANLQGLCPGCHRHKNRKDAYDRSQARKKGLLGSTKRKQKTDSFFPDSLF